MGEAKRRQLAQKICAPLDMNAVNRVAVAMRKLATAASSHQGSDCYIHAYISQHLLKTVGVSAEIVAGYAAWRVGQSDGSVVGHTPQTQGYLPPGAKGFPYHVWLQVQDQIIDLTTYQLRRKATELDALDGGVTEVDWCPDILVVNRQDASSYKQVAQGDTGLFYYERNIQVENLLSTSFISNTEDLAIAEMILSAPDVKVFGSSNINE